jgi:hypothetical protein
MTYDEEDDGKIYLSEKKYEPEGTVTDEIREDFAKLGWVPIEWSKDKV